MKPAQKDKVGDPNSSPKVAAAAAPGPATFLSNEFIKKQKQLMKKRNISTTSSLPLFKFNIIPGLLVCLGCTLFNPIATYVISISQVNNFQASLTFLSKLLSKCLFILSICFFETKPQTLLTISLISFVLCSHSNTSTRIYDSLMKHLLPSNYSMKQYS